MLTVHSQESNNRKPFESIMGAFFPFLSAALTMLAVACIFDTFNLSFVVAIYTLLLFLPVYGLLLGITRRFHVAAVTSVIFAFLLFYIDQLVYSARLTHIRASDFILISQATRVAERYSPVWNSIITTRILIAVCIIVFVIFLFKFYELENKKKYAFLTGLCILAISVIITLSGLIPNSKENFDFASEAENKGLLYSWYCQVQSNKMEQPKGYSKQSAQSILARYEETTGTDKVRIIAIMDESLADYSLLGEPDFQDPLPFFHSLKDNTFKGKLAVSVLAGGTCNTEYEFLTGNSMAFLPKGSTPYLQYVSGEENSMARDLAASGYNNIAIHPYYAEEWNRTQVFDFLGFDKFISGVDFGNTVITNGQSITSTPDRDPLTFGQGPEYVRGLISDKSCFDRVLQESQDISFVFAVTMQNHGGYAYKGKDFRNEAYVSENDSLDKDTDNPLISFGGIESDEDDRGYKTNQYLTCIHLTDTAFQKMIEELRHTPQKTMVLMFGDHQPGLHIPDYFVRRKATSQEQYYIVPYVLWANYDIEFEAPEYTSPNYLSAILKKNAGIPLTQWDQFRLDKMKKFPVMTSNFIIDKDGKQVGTDELQEYEILQYMRMFDRD